jgi:hypothetical protein
MKNKPCLSQDIHIIQQFTQGDRIAVRSASRYGGNEETPIDGETLAARLKIIASAKRGVVRQEKQIDQLKKLLEIAIGHIESLEGSDIGATQKYLCRELKKIA